MSRQPDPGHPATPSDFYAIPEDERFHELIAGDIIQKGSPSGPHGLAQAGLIGELFPRFNRKPGGRWPGGWVFLVEVEIALGRDICRPDVAGWRRERLPDIPTQSPIHVRPDWTAEVLSSNRQNDLIRKKHIYHREGVPHYWIVDPEEQMLTVHRHHPDGYIEVLAAVRADRVRAEPFEAIEFAVGVLFGDEIED